MNQSACITLVKESTVQEMTLEKLKDLLLHYRQQLALTGTQLDWAYADAAFPYTIETTADGEGKWFYLKGANPLYKYIVLGVGSKIEQEAEHQYIEIVLPVGATHGDKAKANEFCKYLGKQLKARLLLFNGRTMYYYPRK